jgi:hypothetical protein
VIVRKRRNIEEGCLEAVATYQEIYIDNPLPDTIVGYTLVLVYVLLHGHRVAYPYSAELCERAEITFARHLTPKEAA